MAKTFVVVIGFVSGVLIAIVVIYVVGIFATYISPPQGQHDWIDRAFYGLVAVLVFAPLTGGVGALVAIKMTE